jgi:hypothetical protein
MATCTQSEIAWAAGFIEGDGYIGKNGKSPIIEVTQKQTWPLLKLQELFGGSIGKIHKQGINKASYHRWRICGKNAMELAKNIEPWLSPEKKKKLDDYVYTV